MDNVEKISESILNLTPKEREQFATLLEQRNVSL